MLSLSTDSGWQLEAWTPASGYGTLRLGRLFWVTACFFRPN
jgi:hypothetical protein